MDNRVENNVKDLSINQTIVDKIVHEIKLDLIKCYPNSVPAANYNDKISKMGNVAELFDAVQSLIKEGYISNQSLNQVNRGDLPTKPIIYEPVMIYFKLDSLFSYRQLCHQLDVMPKF